MLKEAYCSYEVSRLLKEKGMNKGYFTYYIQKNNTDGTSEAVTTCTHQMAMAWLREVHNIFIVIEPHAYDYVNKKYSSYIVLLWQNDNYYKNPLKNDFPSYEETVEAALKYTLKNLI